MPQAIRKKTKKPLTKRTIPGRKRELAFLEQGQLVAGVDEVGRGAWAGPVVAAAVILSPDYRIKKVRDSKLLTALERERLADRIYERSQAVGIGEVSIDDINQNGLSWAIKEAGIRAVEALKLQPDCVLLDGNWNYFASRVECTTIVDGDAYELCISAASVIAKVHRDARMRELHHQYPEFNFALNKGYGTKGHQSALRELGPTPAHRLQWAPVVSLLQAELPI